MRFNDGKVISQIYEANLPHTGMRVQDISYSEYYDKAVVAINSDDGFVLIFYDPATDTFSNSFIDSARTIGYASNVNEFLKIGGNLASSNVLYFSKLIGGYGNVHNQNIGFVQEATTFTVNTTLGDRGGGKPIVTTMSNPTISATTTTYVSPGIYNEQPDDSYYSDVVYRGGLTETIYVQESYSGQVDFNVPCSILGTTSIVSTILDHPLYPSAPKWITLSPDELFLNVSSPSYETGPIFYLLLQSMIHGENVNKMVTVELYK
jgi:hypothetical protein